MSSPVSEKRVFSRQHSRLAAKILLDGSNSMLPCVAWDISLGGAKLAAPHHKKLPRQFTLVVSDVRYRCRLTWRDEKFIGVEFTDAVFPERRERRVGDRRRPVDEAKA